MGVGFEVLDDLRRRDAQLDGFADGMPGDFSRDEVGEAGAEAGEEREDGDLEEGVGVGVDAVVSLDDDEALGGRAAADGGLAAGVLREGAGVRGEGHGETGGVEGGGVSARAVDYAELGEVLEHLELGG